MSANANLRLSNDPDCVAHEESAQPVSNFRGEKRTDHAEHPGA